MSMTASSVARKPSVELGMLRQVLGSLERVVVAFSGGTDSSFLSWVARDCLGPDCVLAVTAVSPSLPRSERQGCAALAADLGLRWSEIETEEMDRVAYRRNDGDRCYECKDALMGALTPVARREGATIVLGVNVDDLGDHRPGQRAAGEWGARFPLVEAGFTKDLVRAESRRLGLSTWNKPAAACLASRIPYGTPVNVEVLSRVEVAEQRVRELGFDALRVRHYGDTARIEVPLEDLPRLVEQRRQVVEAVRSGGYDYVTVDLEGLRSGNLNRALRD